MHDSQIWCRLDAGIRRRPVASVVKSRLGAGTLDRGAHTVPIHFVNQLA